MTRLPVLTSELALRLERLVAPALTECAKDKEPGAPTVVQIGRAVASKAKAGRPANKVFCFGQQDVSRLGEILDFYAVDDLEPSFYLAPMQFTTHVAAALTGAGFSQTEFEQAILYGLPAAEPEPPPPHVTIERVTSENLDEFVQTTADGFAWPSTWRDQAMAGTRKEFRADAYHFLARYRGEAAGVGSLDPRDGVAGLGAGAVVPRLRGKGCHLALVRHRLHVASTIGCQLMLGAASFGSGSFRNQQRAGLRLTYVESTWSRR